MSLSFVGLECGTSCLGGGGEVVTMREELPPAPPCPLPPLSQEVPRGTS